MRLFVLFFSDNHHDNSMVRSFWNTGITIGTIHLAAWLLLWAMPLRAGAFPIPERLEFEISYSGMLAGRAVQEVISEGDEARIIYTVKSSKWLSLFFPVDDRFESILTTGPPQPVTGMPRLYRMRTNEGRSHFNREAVFDRRTLEVRTRDYVGNSDTVVPITEQTYDTLSSLFYFRSIPLRVGTSHEIDIFDCKKLMNTEVRILRREEVETPLGSFKTVVIKLLIKSEGIARTDDMFMWLTDDERRLPILIKSKVKIGSITTTLVGGSYWPSGKK
jgi:hypothetical protein